MRTHVALLRGMNVGRNRTVSTADLRGLLTTLGFADVASYVQSGNLVFTCSEAEPAVLAARLEEEIARRLAFDTSVVVLSRDEVAAVIEHNPYPGETDPKAIHAVLRQRDMTPEVLAGIALARERAREKGSPDEATVVGRTLYLRTPLGMGRSELAAQLARTIRPGKGQEAGTARNWTTVTKLMGLLDE
ncbi:MAG: DUF1697 domain-containing protein [Acidimicrobiales bacterium]